MKKPPTNKYRQGQPSARVLSPEVAEIRRLSNAYSAQGCWLSPKMRHLVLNLDIDRLVGRTPAPATTQRASGLGNLRTFAVGLGLLSGGLVAILSIAA